jgi:hypothetical protein
MSTPLAVPDRTRRDIRARREYSAPHLSRRLLITMQNSQATGTGDPAPRRHLAHSRQDLLNLLLGLPDGLSMTRNGNDGVSTGRIEMRVSISD